MKSKSILFSFLISILAFNGQASAKKTFDRGATDLFVALNVPEQIIDKNSEVTRTAKKLSGLECTKYSFASGETGVECTHEPELLNAEEVYNALAIEEFRRALYIYTKDAGRIHCRKKYLSSSTASHSCIWKTSTKGPLCKYYMGAFSHFADIKINYCKIDGIKVEISKCQKYKIGYDNHNAELFPSYLKLYGLRHQNTASLHMGYTELYMNLTKNLSTSNGLTSRCETTPATKERSRNLVLEGSFYPTREASNSIKGIARHFIHESYIRTNSDGTSNFVLNIKMDDRHNKVEVESTIIPESPDHTTESRLQYIKELEKDYY